MPSERITKQETTTGKCDRLETDTGEVVWVMMRDRFGRTAPAPELVDEHVDV